MDLPKKGVVNPFQNDRILKDIFKNDRSNKYIRNEGLEMHFKENSAKNTMKEIGLNNTLSKR